MKLIMAIVNSDDAQSVIKSLTQEGFLITKLATTGGFLMAGNVTIMTGVEDDLVDTVINIIRETSKSRSQTIPAITESSIGGFMNAPLAEITVGGATIFVIPVDRFEKI